MEQSSKSAALCGDRRHVVLFGKKGSGKTSIFNQLTGMNVPTEKHTKNPLLGVCRLGMVGEIVIVDTATLNGTVELGEDFARRMHNVVRRADIAVYVTDVQDFDRIAYERDRVWMKRNRVPFLLVFNRCDAAYAGDIAQLKTQFPDAIFISSNSQESIGVLRARLAQMIRVLKTHEVPLVPQDLVKKGDYVVVLNADAEDNPIQVERELLMNLLQQGANCVLTQEENAKNVIEELPRVDLVVTYARSFATVCDIVPENIPLTSYSFLYGLRSGNLQTFIDGAYAVSKLTKNSRVLIAEGIDHGNIHRDTGRITIPRALRKLAGEELRIDHVFGLDLPENIKDYDLVIHFSGGALTTRSVQAHVAICQDAGVPIANYGTVLAALAGILTRCTKVLLPDAQLESEPEA